MKAMLLLGLLALFATFAQCHMVGGWSDIDLAGNAEDLEGVMNAANWATEQISHRRNSPRHLKLVQIAEARKQVVAGMKYEMTMLVGETDCMKGVVEAAACDLVPQAGHHKLSCTVTVWSQPWMPEKLKFIPANSFQCRDL